MAESAPPSPHRAPAAQPASEQRRRLPWGRIVVVACVLAALGVIATAVALNWEPEPRLGEVSAPRFDPSLAGGGLSSRDLGPDVLIESLRNTEPVGFQILADATDESVIGEFSEVSATVPWTSEFEIDGGDLTLHFRTEKNFLLNYPRGDRETADEIFAIARRYGFYAKGQLDAFDELERRTNLLDDRFFERPLTLGVPESDLALEARELAADWDAWIRDFGEEPATAQLAEAERQVALSIAEVCDSPTNPGLREYDQAGEDWDEAVQIYNASL